MSRKMMLDSLWTVGTRFLSKGANLVVFVILARQLTLAEFGMYGYVMATTLLLSTLLDFGTRHSITYYIGRMPDQAGEITAQALVWNIGAAILGTVGFALYLYYFESQDFWGHLIPTALLFTTLVTIRIQQGVSLGKGDMKAFNQAESLPRTLLIAATLALWALGMITLANSLWALFLTNAVACILLLARNWGFAKFGKMDPALLKDILKRGALFVPGVFLMIVTKRIVVILMDQMTTQAEVGLYFGNQRFSEIITEVALAIGIVIFSHNARETTADRAIKDAARVTRSMLAILLVATIVLFAGANWVVPLVLGQDFVGHEYVYQICLIATFVAAVWTILYPTLSTLMSPLAAVWAFLPGAVVNIVVIFLLVPRYGAVGAAYSTLVANFVISVTFLYIFWLKFKVPPHSFLLPHRSDFSAVQNKIGRKFKRKIKQPGQ